VASWIPVSRAGEVGRGRWLGRDGEVRDSFEAHRGGEAHWRGLSAVARGSAEGLIVARPEEQQVALVVRLEGTGASFLWRKIPGNFVEKEGVIWNNFCNCIFF
jgi:hypothetical protein